jgi:hypothetical protein
VGGPMLRYEYQGRTTFVVFAGECSPSPRSPSYELADQHSAFSANHRNNERERRRQQDRSVGARLQGIRQAENVLDRVSQRHTWVLGASPRFHRFITTGRYTL